MKGTTMNIEKAFQKAIGERYPIPKNIQRLINAANMDLYYGPYAEGENIENEWTYPGFVSACDRISEWIDENIPSEMYFDYDCEYISETEPEPEIDEETGETIEPFWENWYRFERKGIIANIVGKELSSYIN